MEIERIQKLVKDTSISIQDINTIVDDIASKYTQNLDNIMSDLYAECIQRSNVETLTLQNYYIELTNMIYFLVDKVEQLGMLSDISLSSAKDKYASSILSNQTKDVVDKKDKKTVAELQSLAQLDSQYENVVANIYETVYKIVKQKVESAKSMTDALRKILTVKTTEMSLSKGVMPTPNTLD